MYVYKVMDRTEEITVILTALSTLILLVYRFWREWHFIHQDKFNNILD